MEIFVIAALAEGNRKCPNCAELIAPPGRPVVRLHVVTRYLTFEYLPRTAANLALTDIEAQHPNATGP